MLRHLRVRNMGILEDAAIDPGPGLTVITGETGAGKTLLLGALRLLTGEKSSAAAVGPFGDEAQADGLFETGEDELGISRVVPRKGKSRGYLNGSLVAARVLGERAGVLVEIVGQHDQTRLRRPSEVVHLVDATLDAAGRKALAGYQEAWRRYRSVIDDQERLGGDRMALERELDLVGHQADEIEGAGLEPGDDLEMEAMASRLRNAEAIQSHLGAAMRDLESMVETGGQVVDHLRRITELDPSARSTTTESETMAEGISQLLRNMREIANTITDDPQSLSDLEERLTALGDLKRKYGRTLEEVLRFGIEARSRARELHGLLTRASEIEREATQSEIDLRQAGDTLSDARRRVIGRMTSEIEMHLGALSLPNASIEITSEPIDPGPTGMDRMAILFSSDHRLQAGAVHEVASGGELSRLMLALRLASKAQNVETLVFDEVDAGVGGATALALGRKLADLADTCQVLCVTHLPQVAAHADTHYVVERSGPSGRLHAVEGEARLTELSRMLAGLPESTPGRQAAAELLEAARV